MDRDDDESTSQTWMSQFDPDLFMCSSALDSHDLEVQSSVPASSTVEHLIQVSGAPSDAQVVSMDGTRENGDLE